MLNEIIQRHFLNLQKCVMLKISHGYERHKSRHNHFSISTQVRLHVYAKIMHLKTCVCLSTPITYSNKPKHDTIGRYSVLVLTTYDASKTELCLITFRSKTFVPIVIDCPSMCLLQVRLTALNLFICSVQKTSTSFSLLPCLPQQWPKRPTLLLLMLALQWRFLTLEIISVSPSSKHKCC